MLGFGFGFGFGCIGKYEEQEKDCLWNSQIFFIYCLNPFFLFLFFLSFIRFSSFYCLNPVIFHYYCWNRGGLFYFVCDRFNKHIISHEYLKGSCLWLRWCFYCIDWWWMENMFRIALCAYIYGIYNVYQTTLHSTVHPLSFCLVLYKILIEITLKWFSVHYSWLVYVFGLFGVKLVYISMYVSQFRNQN